MKKLHDQPVFPAGNCDDVVQRHPSVKMRSRRVRNGTWDNIIQRSLAILKHEVISETYCRS